MTSLRNEEKDPPPPQPPRRVPNGRAWRAPDGPRRRQITCIIYPIRAGRRKTGAGIAVRARRAVSLEETAALPGRKQQASRRPEKV